MFDRTSKYLSDKARAVRRSQGLKMGADAEDEIVLGDKTTTLLGPGAAVVLATAIAVAGVIAWKMLDSKNPSHPQPPTIGNPDYSADLSPGFGTPEWQPSTGANDGIND